MSFDDDETGVETSQPREFFVVTHGSGAVSYRFNSGQRTIAYDGDLYLSQPSARLEIPVDTLTASAQFTIVLPATHPLVARWLAGQTPPQQMIAAAFRLQLGSGEVEQSWIGEITSMSIENNEAKFLIPSRSQRAMQRRLPSIVVDSKCSVTLYSPWCTVDRASNTFAAHVVSVDGRNVGVAFDVTIPGDASWAQGGQFIHLPTGEPMLVVAQATGFLDLVLRASIYGMRVGDHVTVSRGCNHSIPACRDIFANMVNYVGLPARPTQNPFFPTGVGVGDSK